MRKGQRVRPGRDGVEVAYDESAARESEAATWACTVLLGNDRRQALLAALAELPIGHTWDVTLEHHHDCETLQSWTDHTLRHCACARLGMRAKSVQWSSEAGRVI
jgi:hypothetical protein